ncbi:MAG: ABC transporter substrate-binding protein [Desulfobacterales bacterium]|nr:ABC transporter substrate-binding protein [Desulfobacterales bacterium]MBF0395247.1 ABC transporter substrate-binding protein [Desulfobacterales bacterium]
MRNYSVIFLLCLILLCSNEVFAGKPTDIVKENIDKGVAVLRDKQYNTPEQKKVQRDKMWAIIRDIFDFTEISKRAVAQNWQTFNSTEQKEFSELFAELLKNTYLDKIQGQFNDEQVTYVGEDIMTDTKAVVRTKINRKNGDVVVDYSMMKQKESWKIYDINVEGVSLIKNYRSQFTKILLNGTPKQLIDQIKSKVIQYDSTSKK